MPTDRRSPDRVGHHPEVPFRVEPSGPSRARPGACGDADMDAEGEGHAGVGHARYDVVELKAPRLRRRRGLTVWRADRLTNLTIFGRRLLDVCVKFSEDEVASGVRSTSADTLSDQPLSEWPAGREADRTLAQRTAAVGLTDRGSLGEFRRALPSAAVLVLTMFRRGGVQDVVEK